MSCNCYRAWDRRRRTASSTGWLDRADPLGALSDIPPPPRSGDDWDAFVRTLQTIGSGNAGWPAELGQARCWYAPHLERMHDDATVRQADLLRLEEIAAGYPSRAAS